MLTVELSTPSSQHPLPFLPPSSSLSLSLHLPHSTTNTNNIISTSSVNNYMNPKLLRRLQNASSNHCYNEHQLQAISPPTTTTSTTPSRYPNMKNNFLPRRTTTTPTLQQQQLLLHNSNINNLQHHHDISASPQRPSPSSSQGSGDSRARVALGLAPRSVPTVQEILDKLLKPPEPMTTSTSRQKFLSLNYDHHLDKAVLSVIQNMWAESTINNRQILWKRFEEFCKMRNLKLLDQMDYAIPLFCEHCKKQNKLIKSSSRLQYSKDLSAIAGRFSIKIPITRMYQTALRAEGATIPQKQAPAITFDHLTQLVHQALQHKREFLRNTLYTTIYLMYKTASRFDEVHNITHQQINIINNKEIIINWSNRTKTTRVNNQFRADNVICVFDENGHPQIVLDTLNDLRRRPHLFSWTVTAFDKWIKTLPQPLPKYSAHSIKAFSVTLLSQMAAFNHIPPYAVAVMAKHKIDHPDLLPATTNRYIRDDTVKAHLNPSKTATNLLKWTEDPQTLLLEQQSLTNSPQYREDEDQQQDSDLDLEDLSMGNNQPNQMMMMMGQQL